MKSGAIKHFFLIGGCDGAKSGRNYYTELAEKVPKDCVILTLACGKYRFNKLEFGDIGGIPRLLDVGQCNDAYSAVQIALALAGAFNCGVNDLPLSFILSWYEQKAHVILLSLLSPGDQEHQARPVPAGLHHPERPQLPGGELQHRPDHHGGRGPEGGIRAVILSIVTMKKGAGFRLRAFFSSCPFSARCMMSSAGSSAHSPSGPGRIDQLPPI